MEKLNSIIKQVIIILLGIIWGIVSFFWLLYSILFLGNFIYEPGSYDYEAEGGPMRILGLTGCIIYMLVFVMILFYLKKKKRYLIQFLLAMVLSGTGVIYIFIFL